MPAQLLALRAGSTECKSEETGDSCIVTACTPLWECFEVVGVLWSEPALAKRCEAARSAHFGRRWGAYWLVFETAVTALY